LIPPASRPSPPRLPGTASEACVQEDRTRGRELHDATPAFGGDVAAFSRLTEVRSGRVRGIAPRVLGPEDAEDVYQEVRIRVWRSIGGLREERLRHLALLGRHQHVPRAAPQPDTQGGETRRRRRVVPGGAVGW
jgi:hypothetical protein